MCIVLIYLSVCGASLILVWQGHVVGSSSILLFLTLQEDGMSPFQMRRRCKIDPAATAVASADSAEAARCSPCGMLQLLLMCCDHRSYLPSSPKATSAPFLMI